MKLNHWIVVFPIACCLSAYALTPGWDNINPERTSVPPQKIIWRADFLQAKMDLRDGAEGTLRVVGADGEKALEIVKSNAKGRIVVTLPPFAVVKDAKLRLFANCASEDGDPELGEGFVRLYGKKEDLAYFMMPDERRDGGPYMQKMVNSPPGGSIRKLAYRIADSKTGTNITAAIVVSGPPCTSRWTNLGVEDHVLAKKAWNMRKQKLEPVDVTGGMISAEAFGAKLNDDFSQVEVSCPEAVQARQFSYTAWLQKVDAIIDLCKLKTHGMMGLSCAVKNFFGTIPGTKKPEYHYRYPRAEDFADMLVDLYEYSKPRLCVCDAVIGMEGNGPTQGTPRKIGCLIASGDGHKLDAVAAGLIGLTPKDVPTLQAAVRRGLVPEDAARIAVYGDPARFAISDFKTVQAQSSVFFRILGDGVIGRIADFAAARILTPFPKLASGCVGCGKCAQVCPARAIAMKDGRPRIDRRVCIHCFCCQEFCPKGAMQVGRHALMKLLGR